ncbi:MAG: HAD family phosphatase [Elusimicrobiaceae bacterium]|nr:HAD family phosphatase [Elusimicrobiaceae bacterium]
MITHVIFDMDGLLLSTEPVYFICYQRAAAEFGLNFTFELFESCVGMSTADSARLIDHYFSGKVDIEQLYKRTYAHFEQYIREGGEIDFRPGAKEAVEFFSRRGLILALASSNIQRWVDYLLTKKGVKTYFSVITTADDVNKPKPDPEIYLTTAQRLHVPTENCLAFEDSVAGATSAITAGMRTCVIPQIKQPDTFVREHAFKVYHSLEDIYPDMDELLH